MPRYNIYFRRYSILGGAYSSNVLVVNTDDIYHEIGKLICRSLEHIDSIRYTEPRASKEDCEKLWFENGYEKIDNNYYRCTRSFSEFDLPDVDLDNKVTLSTIKECAILSARLEDYRNFLSNNCYLFEDMCSYEFMGIYHKCVIKMIVFMTVMVIC